MAGEPRSTAALLRVTVVMGPRLRGDDAGWVLPRNVNLTASRKAGFAAASRHSRRNLNRGVLHARPAKAGFLRDQRPVRARRFSDPRSPPASARRLRRARRPPPP